MSTARAVSERLSRAGELSIGDGRVGFSLVLSFFFYRGRVCSFCAVFRGMDGIGRLWITF